MMAFIGSKFADISISFALIALSTIVLLFWIYARWKLNYWKRQGVEQLSTYDLIFGNFKDAVLFRTAPGWHLGVLHKAARTDVPYLGFYIFHKPCFLVRDPEIIKQIMIRDFDNFSDRHFAGSQQKDSIGMKNLFGLKNPAWKYLRTKITPTLTRGKLREMFPLMFETGEPMMEFLKNQKEDSKGVKLVDVQEISYTYATDLIASVALGTKMDSFNYPNAEFTKAGNKKLLLKCLRKLLFVTPLYRMTCQLHDCGSDTARLPITNYKSTNYKSTNYKIDNCNGFYCKQMAGLTPFRQKRHSRYIGLRELITNAVGFKKNSERHIFKV